MTYTRMIFQYNTYGWTYEKWKTINIPKPSKTLVSYTNWMYPRKCKGNRNHENEKSNVNDSVYSNEIDNVFR